MSPEKWQKIKAIFNEAVELSPDEWEFVLSSQNGETDMEILAEVRRLLAAEKQNRFAEPIADISNLWREDEAKDFIGRQIGSYKIVKEIGRGGMGIVFEAVRSGEDFSQTAALKLLKRGMDSDALVRRFRHERRILSSLEHPNIARLLDGGISAEGTPFFAMEFVDGKPLDEFCNEKNLSINERQRLFLQVCAAVSFAHSRLVVHRDLKPTNILVTNDGGVKLLDFGISKILSPENDLQNQTVTALGMMTPQYASPEQIKGEIVTTATDIYSLGVILYEILTGAKAYQFPNQRPDEMAKVICEVEPPKPSSVISQQLSVINISTNNFKNTKTKDQRPKTNSKSQKSKFLRGDLDNIILKALRKEPSRRYVSVEQFAGDIKRHLDGLPVIARPDTFSYRFEKFVLRNRAAVVAGVLIFLSLIGGISATGYQARRAEQQRVLAEKRFNDVRELANAFVFKYHDEIKNLPGSTKLRETMVKDALVYLDRLAADQSDDASLKIELAQAYMKVGDAQGQAYDANLGDTAGAIESYGKAVTLLVNASAGSSDLKMSGELITACQKLASLLSRAGETAGSAEMSAKAVLLAEKLHNENPKDNERILALAGAYLYQSDLLSPYTESARMIEIYKKALVLTEKVYRAAPEDPLALRRFIGLNQRLGFQYFLLAETASETGKPDSAQEFYKTSLPFYQTSLAAAEKQFAIDEQNAIFRRTFFALKMNVAQVERELGETDSALRAHGEAVKEFETVAAADEKNFEAKSDLAQAYEDFALTYAKRGEFSTAFSYYFRAVSLMDEAVKNDPNNKEFWRSRRDVEMRFGDTLLKKGEFKKALEMYKTAYEKIRTAPMLQETEWQKIFSGELYEKLGDVFAAQNNAAQARANYRKALEIRQDQTNSLSVGDFNPAKLEYLREKAAR